MRAVVAGMGHAVPDRVLTNLDLEKMVDTTDEWIFQRTGIRERRIASEFESTGTFAIAAAKKAVAKANIDPADIDLIVCGTVTGDFAFPSTSCLIQQALGAKNSGAVDLGAACAGFAYSLAVASGMIESGQVRNALVIGADALSKVVDWTDRSTCVLFGDGAGAALLVGMENTDRGVLKSCLLADGCGSNLINLEIGGNAYPPGSAVSVGKRAKIFMAGSEVYRFAVTAMPEACLKVLDKAGLTPDDIDLFVPHQANLRIIESAANRMNLEEDRIFVNVGRYGNTSGGSIPLALSEAVEFGRLKPGMVVVTVGFGAGLVWGANVIRW